MELECVRRETADHCATRFAILAWKDLSLSPLSRNGRGVKNASYSHAARIKGNRYQSQIHYSNGSHCVASRRQALAVHALLPRDTTAIFRAFHGSSEPLTEARDHARSESSSLKSLAPLNHSVASFANSRFLGENMAVAFGLLP